MAMSRSGRSSRCAVVVVLAVTLVQLTRAAVSFRRFKLQSRAAPLLDLKSQQTGRSDRSSHHLTAEVGGRVTDVL